MGVNGSQLGILQLTSQSLDGSESRVDFHGAAGFMSLENRERLPSFTVHRGYCLCFALVSRQKYILLSVPADINSIPVINACNLHIKTQ